MNRNHNSTSEPAEGQQYSHANPPLDEKEALDGIDALDDKIVRIETQIASADATLFKDEDDFKDWRRRATGALIFTKKEKRFLEGWLRDRRKDQTAIDQDEVRSLAEAIKQQVRELAEEIGATYSPKYGPQSVPTDFVEASTRLAELNTIKQELQRAFASVTAAWTALGELPIKALSGVKAPLQRVSTTVEIESAFLRRYLKANQQVFPPPIDWRTLSLAVIDRAVTGNFTRLSDKEQQMVEFMRLFSRQRAVSGQIIKRAIALGLTLTTQEQLAYDQILRPAVDSEQRTSFEPESA